MIGRSQIEEIREQMRDQAGPAARSRARQIAERYGISESAVYAHTSDVRPARKRRSNAGNPPFIPSAIEKPFEQLTLGKGLSVTEARASLVAAGFDVPSESTLRRWLRFYRISERERGRDLTPHIRFEAGAPNELWQIDASGSTMFFLDADGSVVFDNPLKYTKNKPDPTRPRVWIIAVIDDYSRAAYAELAPANDTTSWLTALGNAARDKSDPTYPFCGLPDKLYSDQDAIIRSQRFQRILTMFDPPIGHLMHLPYHARATGKVERWIGTIKRSFERRHKPVYVPGLEGEVDQRHHEPTRWRSLDEANAALRVWLVEYNNRRHGTTRQSPFVRWMSGIVEHPPRVVDDAFLTGVMRIVDVYRDVAFDLSISVNGVRYQLPRREPFVSLIDRKLRIWWSPDLPESVWADAAGESFEIYPVGRPVPAGEFRAIIVSKRDAKRREVAAGPDPDMQALNAAHDAPVPTYVRPKPSVADIPEVPAPSVIMRSRTQALLWLRDNGYFHNPLDPDEISTFAAMWAESARDDAIVYDDLKRWARAYEQGGRRRASAAGGAA